VIRFQPAIQFLLLIFAEWNGLWDGRNAVPYVFDHLNPLGNAQFENVCCFCAHSIPLSCLIRVYNPA